MLYSSGTTGLPKAIVQGQGGVLLEQLKKAHLHSDLGEGDRFFWFTTTGWMMWNFLVAGLLTGSAIVLYDGQPDPVGMWDLAARAAYLLWHERRLRGRVDEGGRQAPSMAGARSDRLDRVAAPPGGLRAGCTHHVPDVWLFSTSGGTDLCTAFVGGSPVLPVYAGELQARAWAPRWRRGTRRAGRSSTRWASS